MDIKKIIKEQISEILLEDYQSIKELKILADTILEFVVYKESFHIFDFFEFNNRFDNDYFFHDYEMKEISESKNLNLPSLNGFLKNNKIIINFDILHKPSKTKAYYSYVEDGEHHFNKEIVVNIDSIMIDKISDIVSEIFNSNKEHKRSEIYNKILDFFKKEKIDSFLIHELQHAYDDFRSKGKIYKEPKSIDFQKKYENQNFKRENLNKELQYEYFKEYLSLPFEVWARFSQTMNDIEFTEVITDIDIKRDILVPKIKMKSLKIILVNFFNHKDMYWIALFKEKYPDSKSKLTDIQKRMVNAISSFYYKEKENIEKINKINYEKIKQNQIGKI